MASDEPTPRATRPSPPPVPPGTGTVGISLFLLSLFMLFSAAMVGYIFVRLAGTHSPARGSLHFPAILWISTVLVVGVSFTMSRAVRALRHEHQPSFLKWMAASLALAIGFLLVQTPAMIVLLAEHQRLRAAGLFLYGLVFVLILLHALHVLGGMIALIRVTARGRKGIYDHEHYQPVRHTALYWHFLDVIWILMFLTFLLTA